MTANILLIANKFQGIFTFILKWINFIFYFWNDIANITRLWEKSTGTISERDETEFLQLLQQACILEDHIQKPGRHLTARQQKR